MNTIDNKKGNVGWIAGYYNTDGIENDYPRGKIIKTYIKKVKVMSCGKKQMTLLSLANDRMTKYFHDPGYSIYATEEDAKQACQVLIDTFISKSLQYAPKALAIFEEYDSGYTWYAAKKESRLSFIEDLKNNNIPSEIVVFK